MSLILDALNRAEQERSEKNHVPTLQSMHGTGDSAQPSLLQRLHLERWLIVLVVAYLLFDYFTDPSPSSTAPVEAPAATLAPASPPVAEGTEPHQAGSRAAPAPAPTSQAQPAAAEETKAVPHKGKNREIESLYEAPKPVSESQLAAARATPKPVATAPKTQTQDRGAANTALAQRDRSYANADEITDLPLTIRRQIPSLKYSDHMPAGDASQSRVTLNGAVYQEGDQIVPGLLLVEISEPGIILEFRGDRFRLEAYNSWINFP